MEVVTGEYGNFTSQLKTAAIDKSWRTPPQITDSRNICIFFFFLVIYVFDFYLCNVLCVLYFLLIIYI